MPLSVSDVRAISNNLIEIFKELQKFLGLLFFYKKLQLIILIILILVVVFFGQQYWKLDSKYQRIVNNTLLINTEPTPQRFKGMEAFILSYIKPDLDSVIKRRRLADESYKIFKSLRDSVRSFTGAPTASKYTSPFLQVVSSRNFNVLTDNNKEGFLFLPINLIGKNFSEDELESFAQADAIPASLVEQVDKNENLKLDIAFTKKVAAPLQNFALNQILDSTVQGVNVAPSQVYIIAKSGINRIFSRTFTESDKARSYYGKQFGSTTFFPNRPYYLAAFEGKFYPKDSLVPKENSTVGEYFYVSKPYMDLAGNGFVITLSRAIMIDGEFKGALCFDLPLGNTTIHSVLEKISADIDLTGNITSVRAKVNESGTFDILPLEDKSKVQNSGLVEEFTNKVLHLRPNELSTFKGNINIFSNVKEAGVLKVSLPIGNINNPNEVEFLLFEIDLNRVKSRTFTMGFWFVLALVLVVFFLTYLYGSTIKRFEEYESAFNRVDRVMYKSPIPYCRLGSDDKIKDANPAFCKIMGYNPHLFEELQQLKGTKFISLCADEASADKYLNIEERRKNGLPVQPYVLKFKSKTGKIRNLIVVSDQFPFSLQGKLPETFGLLLDPSDKNHNKYLEKYSNFSFTDD